MQFQNFIYINSKLYYIYFYLILFDTIYYTMSNFLNVTLK